MKKGTVYNLLLTLISVIIIMTPSFVISFSVVFFIIGTIYIVILNKNLPFISTILISLLLGIYTLINPLKSQINIYLLIQGLSMLFSMIYLAFGCILYFYNKDKAKKIIIFSLISLFVLGLAYAYTFPTPAPPLN